MKRKLYNTIFMSALVLTALISCQDFLDTTSPSVVDPEFVFSNEESARAALYYGYETLRANGNVHSVGLFWSPIWGSDIEDNQDIYNEGDATMRQKWFYPGGTEVYNINAGEGTDVFEKLYSTISIANSLITNFEKISNFTEIMSGEPNALSDIYGQAVTLRATCYWELCRWYGDVPHALIAGEKAEGLVSRYAIYDYHIEKLIEVESHMFRPGEGRTRADVMNRTYAQGLIGRMCLYNAGYATRRTDLGADFYKDGKGNVLTFDDWSVEKNNAIYGRRSDWREVYGIAKQYLQECANNSGSVVLHTTDPRSSGPNGELYENPFQYAFQQMHAGDNFSLSDESVYEIPMENLNASARPAYTGRPSSGGDNGAPNIGCGTERLQPYFYYGWFDNNDMRRDASGCVTGSTGQGVEQVQTFDRSDWGRGYGTATNKYDWNRIPKPNTAKYGNSGINVSYMRISDVYLMLAEVYAALGEEGNAITWLGKVHHRAFPGNNDPNFNNFISESGSVLNAVIKERALEFSGEGIRRFDIIRTGILPEVAVENRRIMKNVIEGVTKNNFYKFENGNELPGYIWIKMVDAKTVYGYRLTAQTPPDKIDDPVLFPGWRGQHNDWASVVPALASQEMTNVAIKGLFQFIDSTSTAGLALKAEGYSPSAWGNGIPSTGKKGMADYMDSYANKLFAGYSDADYATKNPPIHLLPFTYKVLLNSGITNGYGFRQE